MMKLSMSLAVFALAVGFSSVAHADDIDTAKPGRGVITLPMTKITSRLQKPQAAVDVARLSPQLTLPALDMPFLGRIEGAISTSPF